LFPFFMPPCFSTLFTNLPKNSFLHMHIGLTGGIGSGKSTVAEIFRVLGVPVYDADSAARRLMQEYAPLKAAILQHFGAESYQNDVLNRPYIASIVFGNPEKLALLNSLVHPETIRDANEWAARQEYPYTIKEAALMFESESFHHVDKVIGVTAPRPLRIQRVMQRDKVTKEAVEARMQQQISDTIKMRLCDYVIINDETKLVIPQVYALHESLLALAHARK
jgi:dephospho-CoA kinase